MGRVDDGGSDSDGSVKRARLGKLYEDDDEEDESGNNDDSGVSTSEESDPSSHIEDPSSEDEGNSDSDDSSDGNRSRPQDHKRGCIDRSSDCDGDSDVDVSPKRARSDRSPSDGRLSAASRRRMQRLADVDEFTEERLKYNGKLAKEPKISRADKGHHYYWKPMGISRKSGKPWGKYRMKRCPRQRELLAEVKAAGYKAKLQLAPRMAKMIGPLLTYL